ncbi:chemotaxis protein CheR [Microbulbifer harenosus]|uniref:Chemotaxis protein methyltransferase n=1 Tax=Microbulbifer harenosus TaxID=2576840 RepID=A0ABY2UNR4_9GAMM|nr:chemotaxis protein CheR [Microbulbifer harenosus]
MTTVIQTPAPAAARDIELTDRDFKRVRELIAARAGIVLAEHKRDMVYSRLGRCIRKHGLLRFSDYLNLLDRVSDTSVWDEFVNALTTNLTAFFRESHHFELLADHFRGRRDTVRIWSAGSSTGEEPYSIAMTLSEVLGSGGDLEVWATDIDSEALARARAGVYPLDQVRRQVSEERMKCFFQKGSGARAGFARVRPTLAQKVRFEQFNLVGSPWAIKQRFDAIFCRNVMIYFDRATQARLLENFAPLLKPDGLLFVGHSENFTHISQQFRLRGQTVYVLS